MKKINLQLTYDKDSDIITFKTIGTVWEDINVSSLSVVVHGEDKVNPLFEYVLDSTQIDSLQDSVDGLQAAASVIIPDYENNDNFYIISIFGKDVDDEDIKSNWFTLGFTNVVEFNFRNNTMDDLWDEMFSKNNLNANDIMLNLSHANGHFFLDHLYSLSTLAGYSYDREVAWRKLYKVLNSYYGN